MNWIDLLVSFVIFIVIVIVAFYAVTLIARKAGFDAEVTKIVLYVLGAAALIVFLVRFIAPMAQT